MTASKRLRAFLSRPRFVSWDSMNSPFLAFYWGVR